MTTSMNTNRMQVSATGRSCPALSPGPTARAHIPLDQLPSLHLLRADQRRQFVRRLRQYYAAVRLPATVHHRRTSLDFTMRPMHHCLGGRRSSRFSRRLLPYMPGVSDLAGYQRPLPRRSVDCGLPLPPTGRHPELSSFRGSIPSLYLPLSMLRRRPYERRRMTRGRHGWLDLNV